ncbi:arylsulfatase [Leptospira wolbachii serovar Codice str. CDC]|uniref:Arylsulfatase n=1 Tax=Leptospira wolbachii serovar Codice str. CDC TaxID=1218599 RepID=R8ZZ60_9LEPT|nr:sulfatase-like hydrolase/transferase [Leptospira wolbachii]EOQ95157.1 arylsulfatase [Leptospira wolbachii serovar Codice str. CDC]
MFFLYLFLYCFHGSISISIGAWNYFHGILITTFTFIVLVLELFLKHKQEKQKHINTSFRLGLWTLYVIVIGYEEVYQTALTFDILIYFFKHASLLYADFFSFIYQWKLRQWIVLGFGFYLIFSNARKQSLIAFSVAIFLILTSSFYSEWKETNTYQYKMVSPQVKRGKTVLESIPDTPNLVFVLLEGVSRKQLSSLQSRYIDFSILEGSHFWIPMPHTSKSLFTWMTGESQLNHSRLQVDDSLMDLSFPMQLQKRHNYRTFMIYTQSIYFEGMDRFFPKIFQFVFDKTYLEKQFGSLYSSFSWGMDDRVVLSALKQINDTKNHPSFVLIGLSQTHSPYFVFNESSNNQWKSPLVRYEASLKEEIEVLDSIITYWKENSNRETVLILSADHGESFGEEGAHAHNYSLYNQETDVPFLLYFIKSGQVYQPKQGSSVDFKETILTVLDTDHKQRIDHLKSNFFHSNYEPNLILKTWNSEIQKSWITKDKKYIYHSDRDQLLQMDWMDGNRIPITDVRLKQHVLKQIYSGIR